MLQLHLRNSIRWKLPFSYAAIALIAALASGVALLTMLQSYYAQRESDYLRGNTGTITSVVRQMIVNDMPLAAIQAHVETYSFLAQVRVRLISPAGEVLADSGVPLERSLLSISAMPPDADSAAAVAAPSDNVLLTDSLEDMDAVILPENYARLPGFADGIEIPIEIPPSERAYYTPVITLNFLRVGGAADSGGQSPAGDSQAEDSFVTVLPATSTLYGFDLSADTDRAGVRSDQHYTEAVLDDGGETVGYIELSDGPAYGRQIVERVASGWVISGALAVLLGAAVGWTMSRRLSAPLLALTAATRQMAAGHLSARADVVGTDELGLLASSFNHMAGQVETTVLALRRFVADAAHELHTPLTALRTNIELALDEAEEGVRHAYLERAQSQLLRLENVTDSLLDLSRIEAGERDENHHPVALNALVQEVSELYASRSEQAELSFTLDLPDRPVTVQGNLGQLRRALSNLLDNAVKFTPGGESICVDLHEQDGWVEIHVADRGIGIPPDELPLVFNRFHRCRNVATYPGSGLGLAIVKSIVEAHGGQIGVENTQPGTRFTLRLPTLPQAGASNARAAKF